MNNLLVSSNKKMLFATILIFVVSLLNFTFVEAKEGVQKEEKVTVTIKAKPFERFELKAPPIRSLENVTVRNTPVMLRANFESPIQIVDVRGEHDGWQLSISAEQFQSDENKLPKGTLSLEPLKEIRVISENAVLPKNVMQRNMVIDDGEVLIVKADVGEGMGAFELDFGEEPLVMNLTPENIESGIYQSNIKWTLESGSGESRILREEVIEIEVMKDNSPIPVDRKDKTTQGNNGSVEKGSNEIVKNNKSRGSQQQELVTTGNANNEVNESEMGKTLPNTATSIYKYLLHGLSLFIVGVIFYFINFKRNREHEEIKDKA